MRYIYQYSQWPNFQWNSEELLPLLSNVRHWQGKLIGKMQHLGFDLQNNANLETLTADVLKSSEIEGEHLNQAQVRSSLAQRLGIEISGLVPADRNVDGVVDMLLDATQNYRQPLSEERLFAWHNALFPAGMSGLYKILVGQWRDDSTGPMQVVSGAIGREKVHYQAPNAAILPQEMQCFLEWFNTEDTHTEPLIKAGIAHLWFVTLHPFEDGNGRMARALTDMLLARADGLPQRFYSMSTQIRLERNAYYDILEKTQKDDLDVTAWLQWFLECLQKALLASDVTLQKVINKHQFWAKNGYLVQNDRQILLITKLLEGFEGKLTTSKWAKIAKCSTDTALRDVQDLVQKQILRKTDEGGRSTNYELII